MLAKGCDSPQEGIRRGSLDCYFCARGQPEGDFLGVQHQSFQHWWTPTYTLRNTDFGVSPCCRRCWPVSWAVQAVADKGVSDTIKMHAELMQTSAQRMRPNKRVRIEPLNDLKLGEALFAVLGINTDPAGAELPQRLVNYSPILLDTPVHQSQIGFFDGSAGKLLTEKLVRACILGKENDAACIFIQPVHHIDSVPAARWRRYLGKNTVFCLIPFRN